MRRVEKRSFKENIYYKDHIIVGRFEGGIMWTSIVWCTGGVNLECDVMMIGYVCMDVAARGVDNARKSWLWKVQEGDDRVWWR